MRFEFFDRMQSIGSVVWEGPGQVRFDLPDGDDRWSMGRFFAGESYYLSGTFDEDGEGFVARRRDWTPYEFARACTEFARSRSYTVISRPAGAVEDRFSEGVWEAGA